MPRNAQGLYTLPAGNPVVPNTLIETSWANPTMSDIADALTGSLPRDGSAPMTGPLTLPSGNPSGARHATNKAYVDSFMAYASGLAIGAVVAYASGTVPPGFLLCDGQAVSRTTYADLFSIIGTTFGSGDGSTTFNVPDLRDQFIRGRSATRQLGSKQAGSVGFHTHAVNDPGHAHSATQPVHAHSLTLNAHSHAVTDPQHTHVTTTGSANVTVGGGAGVAYPGNGSPGTLTSGAAATGISIVAAGNFGGTSDNQQPAVTVASATTGIEVGATGGTETVPQNMAFNYIIKAVNDAVGAGVITGITTSDASMLSVDNANPVVPNLVAHSNVAFGMVKLDLNGKVPVAQMPAGVQTFLGTFDASSGQNPTQKYPSNVYTDGMTYLLSAGGTILVHNPATGTAAMTAVSIGWNLIWLQNATQPVGWYFIQSAVVTAANAASVSFVPAGTISATNVQTAIEELDVETQAGLAALNSSKAAVGNAVPTMDGTAAPGAALAASREDHVHPTDTSRAPAAAATAAGTSFTPGGTISATNVQNALTELDSEKASLASPIFTGNPTAPTPTAGDNDTSIATTAFVTTAIAAAVPTAQTWQDVTGSRALGTNYTNSTGYPIQVCVTVNGNSNALCKAAAVVGGVTLNSVACSENGGASTYQGFHNCMTFNVPNGAIYRVNQIAGAVGIVLWTELR